MDHECSRCVSVNRREEIPVPKENLKHLSHEPVFLGHFSLPGWPGHSPFFAFKCRGCDSLVIDSPHGYTMENTLYLAHYDCPRGIEIRGRIVTQLPLEERNIKELKESINRGKYIC